ncbi:hypothetical protein BGZ46_000264 [Entomortierella lignicola]|nr:hypothetical protein BGZ46_000264 [Entomortierella lignicola]
MSTQPQTSIQDTAKINSMEALSLDSPQDNKVHTPSDNSTKESKNTTTTTPFTSEALAAQDSQYTNNNIHNDAALPVSINAAAAGKDPDEHHPEIHLQEPSSLPEKPQSSPPASKTSSANRSRLLAEIPSAFDLYSGVGDGKKSATPSVKSVTAGYSSDNAVSSSGQSATQESKNRFEKLPNGSHRHNLSAPKRHQYLATKVRRLRALLDGKKDKNEKKDGHGDGHLIDPEAFEHPLSLFNEKVKDLVNEHHHHSLSISKKKHSIKDEFMEKYGDIQHVVGKGAFGTVRLSTKKDPSTGSEVVFAIKLHGDSYSEVMEYCPGGDLHTLIVSAGTLGEAEAGCFFGQIMNGVEFLHSMGVVHRDLKPENLLITEDGCIKIADFGNSEVFRMPWEKKVRSSTAIRGSGPFIAPEEFTTKAFDGRKVDIWSCGVIYLCMRLGRYTWAEASKGDPNWDRFLNKLERWAQMQEALPSANLTEHADPSQKTYIPKFVNLAAIEATANISLGWPDHISKVINHIMDPNPKNRWQAGNVLDSDWLSGIDNCHPSERPKSQVLDETDFDIAPSHRVGSKVMEENVDVTGLNVAGDIKSHITLGTSSLEN